MLPRGPIKPWVPPADNSKVGRVLRTVDGRHLSATALQRPSALQCLVCEAGSVHTETIIGAPFEPVRPLREMLQGGDEPQTLYSEEALDAPGARLFKIRTADSSGQRGSASVLINRMYATRGYRTARLPEPRCRPITLTASDDDATIGTITVGFDSAKACMSTSCSATRTAARQERQVCEFTKLAMDSAVRSKRVLASLFHVAYIYAHRMMGFDDLLIEVNPRHVRYYDQMLGFKTLANAG